MACEADAYIYVLYRQADGQVFQVFPNSQQPNNRVKARQAVQIPAADDTFRWVVVRPFGKESIKVLASKEPLADLSDPAMRAKFFNPMAAKSLKGIQLELGKPAASGPRMASRSRPMPATTPTNGPARNASGCSSAWASTSTFARTQKRQDGKTVTVYQPSHRDGRGCWPAFWRRWANSARRGS